MIDWPLLDSALDVMDFTNMMFLGWSNVIVIFSWKSINFTCKKITRSKILSCKFLFPGTLDSDRNIDKLCNSTFFLNSTKNQKV